MINRLQNIQGIQGEIFAAEPLHNISKSFSRSYQNGYGDTFIVDAHDDAWIANGADDTIPYLHRLIYRRSTIHNSAVNLKANLIAGGGIEYYPLEEYFQEDEFGEFRLVQRTYTDAERESIIQQARVFAKNIGLGAYRVKAASQLALYGGYYGLLGYSLDKDAQLALRQLYIESYPNVRMGAKRDWADGDFHSRNFYFSRDWTCAMPYNVKSYKEFKENYNTRQSGVGKLPGYQYASGSGFRVKLCGRFTDYRNYYCHPDYEALDALTYMDIDYMISQRDYKDLESGFSLDHIIVRYRKKKATSEEEKAERRRERDFIKNNFRGYNGDRTMITWAEPNTKDNGEVDTPKLWDVIEIPHNNNPERYNTLREERLSKILNAHNIISGELTGLPSLNKTGFSSQSEFLITAQKQLFGSVIKPMQEIFIEDVQAQMIAAEIPVGIKIVDNAANFRSLTEKLLQWAWGKDEIRHKYGDEAMTQEVAEELERSTQNIPSNGE